MAGLLGLSSVPRTIERVQAQFVVMSGLPASGKTTLGRELGTFLGVPVLDKDDYLVSLFDEHDIVDPALRWVLSREADALLESDARSATGGAVIVSFWRRHELSATSGTPTDWLLSLGSLTEVYCDCTPVEAIVRYVSRVRHPGHGDARKDELDVIKQFEALAGLGPLGVGKLVVVDTTTHVDVERVGALVGGG